MKILEISRTFCRNVEKTVQRNVFKIGIGKKLDDWKLELEKLDDWKKRQESRDF